MFEIKVTVFTDIQNQVQTEDIIFSFIKPELFYPLLYFSLFVFISIDHKRLHDGITVLCMLCLCNTEHI